MTGQTSAIRCRLRRRLLGRELSSQLPGAFPSTIVDVCLSPGAADASSADNWLVLSQISPAAFSPVERRELRLSELRGGTALLSQVQGEAAIAAARKLAGIKPGQEPDPEAVVKLFAAIRRQASLRRAA